MAIKVSDASELRAALNSATGGETIQLEAGTYAWMKVDGYDFDPPVTVVSVDPSDPAVFSGRLTVSNSSGLVFDSVEVRQLDGDDFSPQPLLNIAHSENLAFRNVAVEGRIVEEGEGVAPDAQGAHIGGQTPVEGYYAGTAIWVRNSSGVTLDHLDVSQVQTGLYLNDVEDVTLSNSHLHDIRRDGVFMVDARDVAITDNLFDNFKPLTDWWGGEVGDHSDFIQLTTDGGSFGVDGLEISGNALVQVGGSWSQGIFGQVSPRQTGDEDIGLRNISIHDNLINIAHANGIMLNGVSEIEVYNNTLLPASQDEALLVSVHPVPKINIWSLSGSDGGDVSVYGNLLAKPRYASSVTVNGVSEPGDNLELLSVVFSGLSASETLAADASGIVAGLARLPDLNVNGNGITSLAAWLVDALATIDLVNPDLILGGDGDDTLTAPGAGHTLAGGAGDDLLIGSDGIDYFKAGAGNDTIIGGGRGDVISMSAGDSETDLIVGLNFDEGDALVLSGGFPGNTFQNWVDSGNALRTFLAGSATMIELQADFDELVAHHHVTLATEANGDRELRFDLDGDGGADYTLRFTDLLEDEDDGKPDGTGDGGATGGTGEGGSDDVGTGEPGGPDGEIIEDGGRPDGPVSLVASGAGDELIGGDLADRLTGRNGDDTLDGGGGGDILNGAGGDNLMIGGQGADRFNSMARGAGEFGSDTIVDLDFAAGDRLHIMFSSSATFLEGAGFGWVKTVSSGYFLGVTSIGQFVALAGLEGVAAEITDDAAIFGFDVDGDGEIEHRIALEGEIRDELAPYLPEAAPPSEDAHGVYFDAGLFAGGDVLLIEGAPEGWFDGSGLTAPDDVDDGSAAFVTSPEDLVTLARFNAGGATLSDGAAVEFSLDFGGDEPLTLHVEGLSSDEALRVVHEIPGAFTRIGGGAADVVLGTAGQDVFDAGAGADFVAGRDGDDWLEGGAGADTVLGDAGADTVLGGAGADVLLGGVGSDLMVGGAGADQFLFAGEQERVGDVDVIADLDFDEGDILTVTGSGGLMTTITSVSELAALEVDGVFSFPPGSAEATVVVETAGNSLAIGLVDHDLTGSGGLLVG